jgi:hypothetical protein
MYSVMHTYSMEPLKQGTQTRVLAPTGSQEGAMKTPWSERWSWQFVLAVGAMLALMLLVGAVSDALANHAVAPGAQIAWQAQLDRMEEAVARHDLAQAVLIWREAYAAALRSRHWEGLVAVGDAYRRLGALGGFQTDSEAKARQIYLAALFRARQDGSLDGALRVAEAFAELGDTDVVARCLKVARILATQAHDAHGEERIRAFAARWDARTLEVETRNGTLREGTIR